MITFRTTSYISVILKALALLCLAVLACIYAAFSFFAPPNAALFSEKPVSVVIENGDGAMVIANQLKDKNVIRSARITQSLIVFLGGEKRIKAGLYEFKRPESSFQIARRIMEGDYGYVPIRLTIPEGTDSKKIGELISTKFSEFGTTTAEEIQKMAQEHEGYLFPDTYFFAPIATPAEIIEKMGDVFKEKIKPYEAEIASSSRSFEDIIKMASILEREVQTVEDRKMVADLLWRRIAIGMLLQVDATLLYETGKGSAELTLNDLRKDSLYNTYTRKGLPPTPIGNPGIETIEAALRPISNDYLFYLSDKDGITHFSKTHAEHVKLKDKYLR